MLQDALSHIYSMVIEEKVIKYPDRPKADRFFNYPFPAIEEALGPYRGRAHIGDVLNY